MFRMLMAVAFVLVGVFFIAVDTGIAGEYSDIKTYFPPVTNVNPGGPVINRNRVMDSGRTNIPQQPVVVVGTTSPTVIDVIGRRSGAPLPARPVRTPRPRGW